MATVKNTVELDKLGLLITFFFCELLPKTST